MGKDDRFNRALEQGLGGLAQVAACDAGIESIQDQGATAQIDDPGVGKRSPARLVDAGVHTPGQ